MWGYTPVRITGVLVYDLLVSVYLQLNCASSIASDFYFRSHLGCLLDSESVVGGNVASQSATAGVSRAELQSVGDELEQAVSVELTLIVLWKVVSRLTLSSLCV